MNLQKNRVPIITTIKNKIGINYSIIISDAHKTFYRASDSFKESFVVFFIKKKRNQVKHIFANFSILNNISNISIR